MACDNTIQVLEGSILTFKCEVKICNYITGLTSLHFEDPLQDGLELQGNVAATINNAAVTVGISASSTTIDVTIAPTPPATFQDVTYPATVEVTFKAKITDLNKLLNANKNPVTQVPLNTLINEGKFTALDIDFNELGAANVELVTTNVEEYSPEVLGTSITVCPSATNFDAKFCINTICGEYDDGQYVLTVKPTEGLNFTLTDSPTPSYPDVKVYLGCCCPDLNSPLDLTTTPSIDGNGNLIITISVNDIKDAQTPTLNTDSCNDFISVYIPYTFENTTPICNMYLPINGSIVFNTGTGALAELKNFGLYVNVDCGNLVGVSKTIIC